MVRSQGMINYTEQKKSETMSKVQNAIDAIKATGDKVTRKGILEITGLSSGVLSKPYVKEILRINQVLMYETHEKMDPKPHDEYQSLRRQISTLNTELDKYKQKVLDGKITVEAVNQRCNDLKDKISELSEENKMLRGKVQGLLEYIKLSGIDCADIEHLFRY